MSALKLATSKSTKEHPSLANPALVLINLDLLNLLVPITHLLLRLITLLSQSTPLATLRDTRLPLLLQPLDLIISLHITILHHMHLFLREHMVLRLEAMEILFRFLRPRLRSPLVLLALPILLQPLLLLLMLPKLPPLLPPLLLRLLRIITPPTPLLHMLLLIQTKHLLVDLSLSKTGPSLYQLPSTL